MSESENAAVVTPVELMKKTRLKMPLQANAPERLSSIEIHQSVVIVGANGSGKTRLGAWLEIHADYKANAHRIVAQKSLSIPPAVSTSEIEFAEAALLYGWSNPLNRQLGTVDNKLQSKYNQDLYSHLVSDYDKLLVFLFTDEFEQSTKYRQASKGSQSRVTPPETKLDAIKRIWQKVLPHRELLSGAGKIEAMVNSGSIKKSYSASAMSDGERGAFYLIGQCLAFPRNWDRSGNQSQFRS